MYSQIHQSLVEKDRLFSCVIVVPQIVAGGSFDTLQTLPSQFHLLRFVWHAVQMCQPIEKHCTLCNNKHNSLESWLSVYI